MLYERVADLPVRIDGYDLERRQRETSSDFTRTTTVLTLHGDGHHGRGEDVTYDAEIQEAFPEDLPLAGEYTVGTFSECLDKLDLFAEEPESEAYRRYRRWAMESAALDLALRQAGTDLAAALGREYSPVRFVVSSVLGDPPAVDDVREWLDIDPDLEFKLNASPEWSDGLMEDLAATDRVRILDLNGQYEGAEEPDPDFYRRLREAFPDAFIEDPVLTAETRAALRPAAERVTWDAPIVDVESATERPWTPRWLNCKPSRFGTVESLFAFLEYCESEGIGLYGGGQYELDVGREHVHAIASIFYPDSPNDVAPRGYNDPEPRQGLPESPLSPPDGPAGLGWPVE